VNTFIVGVMLNIVLICLLMIEQTNWNNNMNNTQHYHITKSICLSFRLHSLSTSLPHGPKSIKICYNLAKLWLRTKWTPFSETQRRYKMKNKFIMICILQFEQDLH